MTKLSAALVALTMSTSSLFAGGIQPVIVEEVPVVEEKAASSVSPLLIIGLLVLIGVLISRNNDGNQPT
jgi:hypothetical protein